MEEVMVSNTFEYIISDMISAKALDYREIQRKCTFVIAAEIFLTPGTFRYAPAVQLTGKKQ
jgi:hypothetical protein